MRDGAEITFDKLKTNGIKDLVSGIALIILFGSLTLYRALTNSIDVDWVTIVLFSLVTLQGIAVMALGIWELHLSKKYAAWDKECEKLKLRQEEAQRALKEAREEAEELNKISTYGGANNDTEVNSTAD